MANAGSPAWDVPFTPSSRCKTTTAQYRVVCAGSSPVSYTPTLPYSVAAMYKPVGIIQTRMTANSTSMTVRVGGLSKVKMGNDSCTAFAWLGVQFGTSGDTAGAVYGFTLTTTASTLVTANLNYKAIIGQSLEEGATGQVIECIIRPQTVFGLGA
jgi:hypothetical protein